MSMVVGEIGRVTLAGMIGCFLACTGSKITGTSPEVMGCTPVEVDEHCISSIGSNSVDVDQDRISSTSIGSSSVDSAESNSEGSQEAESRLKEGPLETMDALEEALPFRQVISRFHDGKSKSFTYLPGAASRASLSQGNSKPENPCTFKRQNILGFTDLVDEFCNSNLLQNMGRGTPKKPNNSSHSIPSVNNYTYSSSGSNSSNSEDKHEPCQLLIPCRSTGSVTTSPGTDTSPLSPPLPKTFTSSTKSFSEHQSLC
ncbi:hypothetical protein IHE45_18G009300 [Dioscorea alata]|uniref:Uncharacterized protein n=1 Tax=Dioscorea alata TaxID=55571 RepID=A0ACB7U564_DIOAL|nr:hypothetical protein IHE45_18G009300 [Dioscorea alata]